MQSIKCVSVGDGKVGKTRLLITYTTNHYVSEGEFVPTITEPLANNIMVDGRVITLLLFDTLGHDDYDRLRPLSYLDTDIFLVCFSVVSPSSFNNIKERWIPEIAQHCPKTPFLLVGTQADLRDDSEQSPISVEEAVELARDLKAARYVECSALTQKGLKNVFDEAIRAALMPVEPVEEKGGDCSML